MVDVSCRWRKPLLLMYNDNYRYGTGLYVPVVNSLDRPRQFTILPQYLPTTPAPLPKVSLAEHDLYAPISFGYGRNLLKPRTPEVPTKHRISSRYFPTYHESQSENVSTVGASTSLSRQHSSFLVMWIHRLASGTSRDHPSSVQNVTTNSTVYYINQ